MRLFGVVAASGILVSASENHDPGTPFQDLDMRTATSFPTSFPTMSWSQESGDQEPIIYHNYTVDTSNFTSGYISTPRFNYSSVHSERYRGYPPGTFWTWDLPVPEGKGVRIYFVNFDMDEDIDGAKVCVDEAEYFFTGRGQFANDFLAYDKYKGIPENSEPQNIQGGFKKKHKNIIAFF